MSREWSDVALPWGLDLPSFIEPKDDDEVLRTSVIFILLTRLNERVMLPEFGSEVSDALFEQNDDVLLPFLSTSIQEAIARWDDRIEFVNFESERQENSLFIRISWKNARDPLSETIRVTEIELTPSLLGVG